MILLDELKTELTSYLPEIKELSDAVSYTHLDVYKRQALLSLIRHFRNSLIQRTN